MPYNQRKIRYVEAYCQNYPPPISGNKVTVNGKARADLQNLERHKRSLGISKVWRQGKGVFLPPPHKGSKMQSEESDVAKCNAMGSKLLPLSDVIEFHSSDYQAVPIPDNSVIYCDIPYKGTETYQRHKKTEFDYERFYDWAYSQTQPIFISEYFMPEDRFVCIAEIKRKETFSSTNNSKKVTERIFVPKHQQTKKTKQLNLF